MANPKTSTQVATLDDDDDFGGTAAATIEPAVPSLKSNGVHIDAEKIGLSGDEVELYIYSGKEDGERDAVFIQLDLEGGTLSYQVPRDTWCKIPVEVFEATIGTAELEIHEPNRSGDGTSVRTTPRYNYKVRRVVKQVQAQR